MKLLDVLGRLACAARMSKDRIRPRISVTVRIEGSAEEILVAVQTLRAGRRSAYLTVEVGTRAYSEPFHGIGIIEAGQIQHALEKLEMLRRQAIIDDETDRRLDMLIREFGRFTA